ncbi:hypothetical protein ACN28C_00035 [Plantactinospora sp. WMMC1484]
MTGALYPEKSHEVEARLAVSGDIEEVGLTEAQSRKLIASIAEEIPA